MAYPQALHLLFVEGSLLLGIIKGLPKLSGEALGFGTFGEVTTA